MASTLTDVKIWQPIIIPIPGDKSEEDQWGLIYNNAIEDVSNRAYYLINEIEELRGANITDVTPVGLAGLHNVNSNLTPTEGTLLTFNNGQWDAVAPTTGINVLQNGTNILNEELPDDTRNIELSIGDWINETGCILSQSTTAAAQGTNSLRVESSATGNIVFATAAGTNGYSVIGGTVKVAMGKALAQSIGRNCSLTVRFYNSSGTFLSEVESSDITTNNSTWESFSLQVTAPTDSDDTTNTAAYYALAVTIKGVQATGEFQYFDDFSVTGRLVARKFLNLLGTQVTDNPSLDALEIGSFKSNYKAVTTDTTAQASDNQATYLIDASLSDVTITLPNGLDVGYKLVFQRLDNTNNIVSFNVLGTVDPEGATASLDGKFTGLQVIHKGSNEWIFLPFSGGAIGEIRPAAPDGSAPSNSGTWLPFNGLVHNKADYPLYKPFVIKDEQHRQINSLNYSYLPHGNYNAEGQMNKYGFYWADYDADNNVIYAAAVNTNQLDLCIIRSFDEGDTWTELTLPANIGSNYMLYQINVADGKIYLNINHSSSVYFYRSDDYGDTWVDLSNATGIASSNLGFFKPAKGTNGECVLATYGTNSQIQFSSDYGDTWSNVNFIDLNSDGTQASTYGQEFTCWHYNGYWWLASTQSSAGANRDKVWITKDILSTDVNDWVETISIRLGLEPTPRYAHYPLVDIGLLLSVGYNSSRLRWEARIYDLDEVDNSSFSNTSMSFDVVIYFINMDSPSDTRGLVAAKYVDGMVITSHYRLNGSNYTAWAELYGLLYKDNYQDVATIRKRLIASDNGAQRLVTRTDISGALAFVDGGSNLPNLSKFQDWGGVNIWTDLVWAFDHRPITMLETKNYYLVLGKGNLFDETGNSAGSSSRTTISRASKFGYDPNTQFFLPDWNSAAYVKVAY